MFLTGTITLSLTEENPRIFDYKKRIPNIFIRDVLRAQLHMKGVGNYNDLYVVDGLVFHSVSIRGTIVGIENNIKKRFLGELFVILQVIIFWTYTL